MSATRRLRNIGILAHIDAGKTTLTERMLHYAGITRILGSVDSGDTVMDFMPQERERGITINSAAISFQWNQHHINLIDTPGHVDFTFEVERALRVLDGAVVVLDAVAGVQSQTETVWKQADRFCLPRFAYVNKMDRPGANLGHVGETIEQKFGVKPLFCQVPVGLGDEGDTADERFHGIVDLASMSRQVWLKDPSGSRFTHDDEDQWAPLDPEQFEKAMSARETLVESIADFDDTFAELYLMSESSSDVGEQDVWDALCRITNNSSNAMHGSRAIPMLCGTAQRNRGVQPLMDAVTRLLPSPAGNGNGVACSGVDAREFIRGGSNRAKKRKRTQSVDNDAAEKIVTREGSPDEPLTALAFKVQNDSQRGDVVFVRVYSGTLKVKDRLLNTTLGVKTKPERAMRLLNIQANNVQEVDSIEAGHIGAIVGLKTTRSGDTLCRVGEQDPLVLQGIDIPPAVFTASIEVGPSSEKKEMLHNALKTLSREDPSLQVVLEDPETKQTLLSGMGELHLHIILDRIQRQWKLPEAELGRMRVAYRETILREMEESTSTGQAEEDRVIGTNRRFAKIVVNIEPLVEDEDQEIVMRNEIDLSAVTSSKAEVVDTKGMQQAGEDNASTSAADGSTRGSLRQAQCDSITDAIESVLRSGPIAGYPVTGVRVSLEPKGCEFDDDSTPAACFACAKRATKRALENGAFSLLEPQMSVLISSPSNYVGSVVSDLSSASRSGIVVDVGASIDVEGENCTGEQSSPVDASTHIRAEVPLRGMVGYSTDLRSLTSGEASFSMSFDKYVPILQTKVVKTIQAEADDTD